MQKRTNEPSRRLEEEALNPQPAEPVKVVSDSEDDIVDLISEYGEHNVEHGRVSFDKWRLREAVSALLSHYSNAPQPMVDMVPPATSRDRWMYEQGRLAERDPRTEGSIAAKVAAQPAAMVEPAGEVRVHDDGEPIYLDGVECQYSIVKGEPWPNCEFLAYVFDRNIAERIAAALNATPDAAQRSVPGSLIAALRNQRQIDKDGSEVAVSRQAVDEAADLLDKLAAPPATEQAQQEAKR